MTLKIPIKPDNFDRILGADEELAPSSGFVSAVMDRVREEAAAPQPIPFPWKRVLPGMILAAAGLVWCVLKLVQIGVSDARAFGLSTLQPAVLMIAPVKDAGWVAGALAVSLLSWLLARRIAGQSGLV